MDLKLENKLALVTGSTAGIGLAIAKALAAEGCRVIVNGRSEGRVTGAIEKIRQAHPQAKLEALAADLAKPAGSRGDHPAFPGGGHPGQQPGDVRAPALRGDQRRRLAGHHRDQLHERRAPLPPLPAGA